MPDFAEALERAWRAAEAAPGANGAGGGGLVMAKAEEAAKAINLALKKK